MPAPQACRSCHAPITWGYTERGRPAPFNPDGTNHFSTCPQRREWRKPEQPGLFDEEPVDERPRPHYDA